MPPNGASAQDTPPVAPSVRATINYLHPSVEAPYMYYREPPPGAAYTNVVDEPHEMEIADMRPDRNALSLEDDGIRFLDIVSGFADFEDDERVRAVYFPHIESVFRNLLGVERVIAYDFSLRRPDHGPARPEGVPVAGTRRRPIRRAHGDFIHRSAATKVRTLAGGDADALLRGRYRAFNFWRPLRGPLTDAPLALCRPASVGDHDLTPMIQYQEGRENYICALRHNPAHRWCYLSGMRADEAIVFSSFNSALPLSRGVVAHCAFEDPNRPADGLPRDSMEVRVMAFGG